MAVDGQTSTRGWRNGLRLFAGLAACSLTAAAIAAEPRSAIYVMRVDGSQLRKVAQVEGFAQHGSPRFSHDGRQLAFDAAGEASKKVFVINLDSTGLKEMGEQAAPDWSPDDKQLVYHHTGTGGVQAGTWVVNADGKGREFLLNGLAPRFSPDGGRIAALVGKSLVVRDLVDASNRPLLDEALWASIAPGFDWSPDGKRIAFVGRQASDDQEQGLWIADVEGDRKLPKLRLRGAIDGQVSWSPDGKQLAIGLDGKIQLLAPDGDQPPVPIPAQAAVNRAPCWSPDGKWIALAGTRAGAPLQPANPHQRIVQLEEVKRLTRNGNVYSLAFTPDGRAAVMGGDQARKSLQLWDLASDETKDYDYLGIFVAVSPAGRTLATVGQSPKIQIVNLDTAELVRDLHLGDFSFGVSFSKDGSRLVAASLNKTSTVWDVATGKQIASFNKHEHYVHRAVFSPDGKEVYSVGDDKMLRVWNAATAAERLQMPHPDAVWGLAVSPDGRWIVTGTGVPLPGNPVLMRLGHGADNALRVWDAKSGQLAREMKGHTEAAYTVDISPDGKLLASGGWDATIRLWDLETGAELYRLQQQGAVLSIRFSPDGTQLLVGGGTTRFVGEAARTFPDERARLFKVVETR